MKVSRREYALIILSAVLVTSFSKASSHAVSVQMPTDADKKTSCYSEGRFYPANSSFLTKDCEMQCVCIGDNVTSCMDLCNPIIPCPLGWKMVQDKEPVGPKSSKCFCTKIECVPAYCFTEDYVKYKIGESYPQNNCSEICTCTKEGRFACRSTCPTITCPKGFKVKITGQIQIISGCRCQVHQCKKPRRMCKANGRVYTNGKLFVTEDCQSKCKCKRNGILRCSSLCPKAKTPTCGNNERIVQRTMPISRARGRCFCTKQICIPDTAAILNPFIQPRPSKLRTCQFANRTLSPGQRFISKDCSDICRCTSKGHLVCLPLCAILPVTCLPNEELVLIRRPVGGSNCSCTRVICRSKKSPAKRENECRVDGHVFQWGIPYVNTNCTKVCTCSTQGNAKCRPLCPPRQSTYCQNGYLQINQLRSVVAPWCTCYVKQCITSEDNRTEIYEHRH